jgi:hypothetical protein
MPNSVVPIGVQAFYAEMILAVDVGNTQTHLGVFEADQLRHQWRLPTDPAATPDPAPPGSALPGIVVTGASGRMGRMLVPLVAGSGRALNLDLWRGDEMKRATLDNPTADRSGGDR